MSQNLKVDRINAAYSKLRISGITVSPTSESLELALSELENMMHEINIDIGYNFEDEPDPNSVLGVERKYWNMINTNLAVRLIADFNKQVPQILLAQASQSMSTAIGYAAVDRIRQVQYPTRMPMGSGNRYGRWFRFYYPVPLPPNMAETKIIQAGETADFSESFSAYLDKDESISSYELEVTSGVALDSSDNASPIINYRLTVDATADEWQQAKIAITTSEGRVEVRYINIEVKP